MNWFKKISQAENISALLDRVIQGLSAQQFISSLQSVIRDEEQIKQICEQIEYRMRGNNIPALLQLSNMLNCTGVSFNQPFSIDQTPEVNQPTQDIGEQQPVQENANV